MCWLPPYTEVRIYYFTCFEKTDLTVTFLINYCTCPRNIRTCTDLGTDRFGFSRKHFIKTNENCVLIDSPSFFSVSTVLQVDYVVKYHFECKCNIDSIQGTYRQMLKNIFKQYMMHEKIKNTCYKLLQEYGLKA